MQLRDCRARTIRRFALNLRLREGISELPSGPREPFKTLASLLMRKVIAVQQRFLATVYRIDEAAFLVEIPRDDLLDKFIGIASLLSCGSCKFRFEFGSEKYFHEEQGTGKLCAWQDSPIERKPHR